MSNFKYLSVWKRIVIISCAVILATLIVVVSAFVPVAINKKKYNALYQPTEYTEEVDTTNSIHFLGLDFGDCIVLESNGHIAVIDSAEDSDNPRGFAELSYKGDEQTVLQYIKKTFSDENGKVYIDFIMGTHAHSDHIGGFDTLILDEDITIGRAYLNKYNPEQIRKYEREEWDNEEVYNQMINALNARDVELIQNIPTTPFDLGEFKITFYNTEDKTGTDLGENDNSIVTLVEFDGKKILLMGDANNDSGDEVRVAKIVGKVDLLKLGHHGCYASNTYPFVRRVKPTISIATNWMENTFPANRRRLYRAGSALYACFDENGIIAVLEKGKEITLYNNIM